LIKLPIDPRITPKILFTPPQPKGAHDRVMIDE